MGPRLRGDDSGVCGAQPEPRQRRGVVMTPHILTRSLDRSATIFILVVAAAGILLPLSNLLLPAGAGPPGAAHLVGAVWENFFFSLLVVFFLPHLGGFWVPSPPPGARFFPPGPPP